MKAAGAEAQIGTGTGIRSQPGQGDGPMAACACAAKNALSLGHGHASRDAGMSSMFTCNYATIRAVGASKVQVPPAAPPPNDLIIQGLWTNLTCLYTAIGQNFFKRNFFKKLAKLP